jgi:hypothetical protein
MVQHDEGKAAHKGKFLVKGQLDQPPALLSTTLARFSTW